MNGGGTRPRARLKCGVGIGDCALDVLGVGGVDAAGTRGPRHRGRPGR